MKTSKGLKDDSLVGGKTAEFYKELSERCIGDSTQLAEQMICLRSDLEKKSVELLKCQRQNSSYYSETDRTPSNELKKKASMTVANSNIEPPPEPQTHRPTPYPLLNKKVASPSTPEAARRGIGGKSNNRQSSSRPSSTRGSKLQPPNVPYSTSYHPHK